jgi:beta-mannosidase
MPPPEPAVGPAGPPRFRVEGHETHMLSTGWQVACAPPDERCDPASLDDLGWVPARVPGTAAGALRDAGLWRPGEARSFDEQDWWFRTAFDAEPVALGEEASLHLDGIATVAEVHLNGQRILDSDSMFAAHTLPLAGRLATVRGDGAASNELAIRCRALAPLLAQSRRPRARWRTRLVAERNLRFFRTMLLGRAPGFVPAPAAVGPWRPVYLELQRRLAIEEIALRPRIEGQDGVLNVLLRVRALEQERPGSVEVELVGPSGTHRAELALSAGAGTLVARGELTVPGVERWWPHTHGEPALHDVRLLVGVGRGQVAIDAGRVGFRELAFGATPSHEVLEDGLDLHVNSVRVFVRGAVWTPLDLVGLAPGEPDLRAEVLRAREAGMNMLRLPGTGAYEATAFHDLCDELGMLVWQDFMFANFDYPIEDERFRAAVTLEASEVLGTLGGRPSLAVVCGNSEVEQQVSMLGLDPGLGRGELFGELLPGLVQKSGADALYLPSAPCGGDLPFRPDRGIANYYGVGGYRRPLDDARRAGVRFAAECLAFSNVPSDASAEDSDAGLPSELADCDPVLRTGIPRDVGADWDFRDVSDHYLGVLFGVDPRALERVERERYLELSRATTGEVMAEVFGEWRRAGSPCCGGLVLWLRDPLPGAGWGVIDHRGVPKLAYHHLRRALAPVAVWTVDEGLGGIVAHVANDAQRPLFASLRVALYRDHEILVEEGVTAVELEPHSQREWNVETIVGHFVDASWAYRFGPPAQDAVVVSLERAGGHQDGSRMIGQSVRFPAARPLKREQPEELGLTVDTTVLPDGEAWLALRSRRLAYGVHIDAPGFVPSDDGFFVEPGGGRCVTLRPTSQDSCLEGSRLGALNMDGHLALARQVSSR